MLQFQRAQSGRPVVLLCECGKKPNHDGRSRWQRMLLLTQEAKRGSAKKKLGSEQRYAPGCASGNLLSPVKSHLQKFLPPPDGDVQLRIDQRWIHWWSQSLYDSITLPKPLFECATSGTKPSAHEELGGSFYIQTRTEYKRGGNRALWQLQKRILVQADLSLENHPQ